MHRTARSGFTLIELLVVIAIILMRDAKENTILVLVEKIPGEPKDN